MNFESKIKKNIGELSVELLGRIDNNFPGIDIGFENVSSIVFDWANLTLVNSSGIREWIRFLSKIPNSVKIYYTNCPPLVIQQINGVDGFLPKGAKILSFFAPYYCEKCDVAIIKKIEVSSMNSALAPDYDCPTCNKHLVVDFVEKQFLSFFKRS